MIFLPSLSFLINGLIILLARIFKREFNISRNTIKTKILAYAIIFMISSLTLTSFIFLIKLSVTSDSNVAILVAVYKNWHLTEHFQALAYVPENEVQTPVKNPPSVNNSVIDCLANLCVYPFYVPSTYYIFSENYLDNSWPHLTYFKTATR